MTAPRLPLLACLLAAPALADPVAGLGERITYHCDEAPLRKVASDLGRLLNRRIEGAVLATDVLGVRPVTLHLEGATQRDAIEAFGRAAGYSLQRSSRWRYALSNNRGLEAARRPLGDFAVSLQHVRYLYDSYLYPGAPGNDRVRATVSPCVVVYAPSDPDALQIRTVLGLPPVLPGGALLNNPEGPAAVTMPYGNDPSRWDAYLTFPAPPPAVARFAELRVRISFAAVQPLRFRFTLPAADGAEAVAEGYRATVSDGGGETGAIVAKIAGPQPDGIEASTAPALLRRDLWAEGRLYAGDQPLYTTTTLGGAELKDGVWNSTWTVRLDEPEVTPDSLRLDFFVPGPVTETIEIAWEDIELPTRQEAPR